MVDLCRTKSNRRTAARPKADGTLTGLRAGARTWAPCWGTVCPCKRKTASAAGWTRWVCGTRQWGKPRRRPKRPQTWSAGMGCVSGRPRYFTWDRDRRQHDDAWDEQSTGRQSTGRAREMRTASEKKKPTPTPTTGDGLGLLLARTRGSAYLFFVLSRRMCVNKNESAPPWAWTWRPARGWKTFYWRWERERKKKTATRCRFPSMTNARLSGRKSLWRVNGATIRRSSSSCPASSIARPRVAGRKKKNTRARVRNGSRQRRVSGTREDGRVASELFKISETRTHADGRTDGRHACNYRLRERFRLRRDVLERWADAHTRRSHANWRSAGSVRSVSSDNGYVGDERDRICVVRCVRVRVKLLFVNDNRTVVLSAYAIRR